MSSRVVLAPQTSREEFQTLATQSGWVLRHLVEADADKPYEEVWRAASGAIHYVEDDRLDVSYVVIMGDAVQLASTVATNLETIGLEESLIWYDVALSDQQRAHALSYIAATALEIRASVVAVISDALRDSSVLVRNSALFAAAYLSWADLLPALTSAAASDPDPRLRTAAERLIAGIEGRI